jgi:uncharacterized integral membrane protein
MKYLWRKIMLTLYILWALTFLILGIQLTLRNATLVKVDVLFWQSPEISVGVVVCIALFLGLLLGLLIMWPLVGWRRYQQTHPPQKINTFKL